MEHRTKQNGDGPAKPDTLAAVLIEPYRSALILQAVDDGLMRSVPPDGPVIMRLRTAIKPETIDEALRLAVLCDSLGMVWVDPRRVPPDHRPDVLSCGLESTGIVQFIDLPDEMVHRGEGVHDIAEIWRREQDLIDAYERILLAQMHAKGIALHWSLLRLLRAARLEDQTAIRLIEPCVRPQDQPFARAVVRGVSDIRVDMTVVSVVHELKLALDFAESKGAKLAGAAPDSIEFPDPKKPIESALQLWRLCIDVLLGEGIDFPTPASLTDVLSLRGSPEVREFRNLLLPFVTALAQGSLDALPRLRREILAAARAFKRFPRIRRFGAYSTYCSLALGVAEGILGVFGPSIALGVVSLGAERLARSWEAKGRWLYMTKQGLGR
jgi:hypothetical protein